MVWLVARVWSYLKWWRCKRRRGGEEEGNGGEGKGRYQDREIGDSGVIDVLTAAFSVY
jgi:hypothetical protein